MLRRIEAKLMRWILVLPDGKLKNLFRGLRRMLYGFDPES